MKDHILGLHHITAIATDAQRNLDFYSKVLGLRLVKKTVNFDDPGVYHLYFGDAVGSGGTILTFFPWAHIVPGQRGRGQATEIGYSVPAGSLDFWLKRFEEYHVSHQQPGEKLGEACLRFQDPDGLQLALVVANGSDPRTPWASADVPAAAAILGFHYVALTLANHQATADLLTEVFGYRLLEQHGSHFRYGTDAVPAAALVDLVAAPDEPANGVAGGSVHHVAFQVKDDATLLRFRKKLLARGLDVTPWIDRQYFHSLYFREPGGVLFELATANPGFLVDEPLTELGTHLLLPPRYEVRREQITAHLPQLV